MASRREGLRGPGRRRDPVPVQRLTVNELGSPRPARGGSIEQTLAGQAQLEILPVIREAWQLVHGVRAMLVAGLLLMYTAVLAASLLLSEVFGVDETTAL